MRKVIYVDVEKCMGCRTCELECAVAHSESKDLLGAISERPLPQARVRLQASEGFAVPLQCRHCSEAPCVTVCPSGALEKPTPDSPVLIDSERCIGCLSCVLVCPFGVIRPDRSGKAVVKCDFCIERQEEGKEPACVAGCPTGALKLVSVEEILEKARREAAQSYLVLPQGSSPGKPKEGD